MSQPATHAGKILGAILLLFVIGVAGAGYYGFLGAADETPVETTKTADVKPTDAAPAADEKPADTKTAEAKTPDAKPDAPSPALMSQLMAPQPTDIVFGNDKAPVTILDYSSLSCPHCAHFHEEVFPLVKKEFIDTGKVRLVFRHFPHNEPGLRAAQLVNCADPKQRANFVKALYDTQKDWAFENNFLADLKPIVAVGGIDSAAFDSCIADKAGETRILEARKLATDAANIESVPSFIINGQLLKEAPTIEILRDKINGATAPAAAKPADKK